MTFPLIVIGKIFATASVEVALTVDAADIMNPGGATIRTEYMLTMLLETTVLAILTSSSTNESEFFTDDSYLILAPYNGVALRIVPGIRVLASIVVPVDGSITTSENEFASDKTGKDGLLIATPTQNFVPASTTVADINGTLIVTDVSSEPLPSHVGMLGMPTCNVGVHRRV